MNANTSHSDRRWTISISGGLHGRRLSTILALEALSELDLQLMLYGPASIHFVIVTGSSLIWNGKGGINFERLKAGSASELVASEKRFIRAG